MGQGFTFRYIVLSTMATLCVIVGLIAALSIGSEWHVILGKLLSTRQTSFVVLLLLVGGIVLALLNYFTAHKYIPTTPWFIEHIYQSSLLYFVATVLAIVVPAISTSAAEGGDIAARSLILLLFFGGFVNGVFLFIRRHASGGVP